MLRRIPSMLLLLFLASSSSVAAGEETSAYEALRSHGLPMGILPKGVKDFRISTESAEGGGGWMSFEAVLDAPCTAAARPDGGILRYARNVSGRMSVGEIAFFSGISARGLFLWFPVCDIRVDVPASGLIYLDVGVVEKKLPLALFEFPADCSPDDEEGDADPNRIADLLLSEVQLISPPFAPPGSSSSSSSL